MVTRLVLLAFASLLLSACFSTQDPVAEEAPKQNKKTLGSVYFEPVQLDMTPLPAQQLQDLRDAYVQLKEVVEDQETHRIVSYRLADLEVLLAEQRQENGEVDAQGLFKQAIEQYQAILAEHPQQTQNAEVLYQLSKAHDLQGQPEQSFKVLETLLTQYPDNPYQAEANFRKGEILYSQNDYSGAIGAYKQVLEVEDGNPYYMMSAYMLGWSYFKLDLQDQAQVAFTKVLDHKLPNGIVEPTTLRQLDAREQLETLPVGEKRLVNDTVRIMALLFSYQGAEKSLIAHFDAIGTRHFEYLIYEQLGQQFLNDDRYRDSAEVFKAFTEQHPAHNEAPFFAVRQIDAYILGEFPSLVLPAKQAFVERYGIRGEFWSQWGLQLQDRVKPFLHEYLQELAQFEHSKAQLLSQADAQEKPKQRENAQLSKQAYLAAANWYREFIETFPHDDQTPQMTFNLGESLFESQDFVGALDAYETYAYQYLDEPLAAEAGYAAILSYREVIARLTSQEDAQAWLDAQLVSQAQFVNRFSTDSRAVDVLHDSVQQLFELHRFELASAAAQQLLSWQPQVSAIRALDAQLVIAHSQFELAQFAQAESAYDQVLVSMAAEDKRRGDMLEKLAASIYKQAEAKVSEQQLSEAVTDFLRVIAKTPNSAIRVNAQFDAAAHLITLEDWTQAISLLRDFRVRFAGHPLTQGIEDKLIHAYQQSEQWLPAAEELLALWQANKASEQGRQALYIAAGYLKDAGERQRSLESYRSYAHSYPQPFNEATEARFIMSEFYLESGEDSKRRFWLNKLIQADAKAGDQRTPRSRYLAAMSSLVFADDTLYGFKKIRLTLPLKTSLKKKKQALDKALKAYNRTLDYKVEEFSTAASFRVADIYHQLAKDLMGSDRPKGLNELELEQYDILLEEQAYPFEEQAIELHQANAELSWAGTYDDWVKQSFAALARLQPGRYNKQEQFLEVTDEIH